MKGAEEMLGIFIGSIFGLSVLVGFIGGYVYSEIKKIRKLLEKR